MFHKTLHINGRLQSRHQPLLFNLSGNFSLSNFSSLAIVQPLMYSTEFTTRIGLMSFLWWLSEPCCGLSRLNVFQDFCNESGWIINTCPGLGLSALLHKVTFLHQDMIWWRFLCLSLIMILRQQKFYLPITCIANNTASSLISIDPDIWPINVYMHSQIILVYTSTQEFHWSPAISTYENKVICMRSGRPSGLKCCS